MQGTYLEFHVHENRRHHHLLVYEWLLEEAKKMGIHGGSVFRAVAGFGRHGVLHEDHFFELAGDLPVEVGFAVSEEEAKRLQELTRSAGLSLCYMKMPVEYGLVNVNVKQRAAFPRPPSLAERAWAGQPGNGSARKIQ